MAEFSRPRRRSSAPVASAPCMSSPSIRCTSSPAAADGLPNVDGGERGAWSHLLAKDLAETGRWKLILKVIEENVFRLREGANGLHVVPKPNDMARKKVVIDGGP